VVVHTLTKLPSHTPIPPNTLLFPERWLIRLQIPNVFRQSTPTEDARILSGALRAEHQFAAGAELLATQRFDHGTGARQVQRLLCQSVSLLYQTGRPHTSFTVGRVPIQFTIEVACGCNVLADIARPEASRTSLLPTGSLKREDPSIHTLCHYQREE
jgi:hypothetical protein